MSRHNCDGFVCYVCCNKKRTNNSYIKVIVVRKWTGREGLGTSRALCNRFSTSFHSPLCPTVNRATVLLHAFLLPTDTYAIFLFHL